jgi:hypothetical protein
MVAKTFAHNSPSLRNFPEISERVLHNDRALKKVSVLRQPELPPIERGRGRGFLYLSEKVGTE